MNYVDLILGKFIEWIDKAIKFFSNMTGQHSQWVPIVIVIFLATKIFKINLKLGGGR
jgi:hypothetical protein